MFCFKKVFHLVFSRSLCFLQKQKKILVCVELFCRIIIYKTRRKSVTERNTTEFESTAVNK